MLFLALSVLLQAAPPSQVRSVPVSVVDEGGTRDGSRDRVALLENGVVREVTRLRPTGVPDRGGRGRQRGNSLSVQALPGRCGDGVPQELPGTRYSLWITGDDRRRSSTSPTTRPRGEGPAPRHRHGGNTLLTRSSSRRANSRDQTKEDQRTAVVVVTGQTTGVGNRDRYRSLDETQDNAACSCRCSSGRRGSLRGPHRLRHVLGPWPNAAAGSADAGHRDGRGCAVAQGGRQLSAQPADCATLPDLRAARAAVARPESRCASGTSRAPETHGPR
jgi:hypothetical protein